MTLATHSPPLAARRPWVRPWAMAGPVLLLIVCLPLLRPLRYPAELPFEEARLIEMVRQNLQGQLYVADTPAVSLQSLTEPSAMFALLLTGPAWVMQKLGFNFDTNGTLMAYMLIALGVTLPVALSAGLIYRMGRLFELPRPLRAALGVLCVAGSGVVSYATTLSAHALSAALLIGSVACLLQTLRTPRVTRGISWTFVAGALAALGAAMDPAALPVALVAPAALGVWRVRPTLRLAGMVLYALGAAGPVALVDAMHARPSPGPLIELARQPPIVLIDRESGQLEAGMGAWTAYHTGRLFTATLGAHGLFSHFPVLLLGAAGVLMLMHRNWPESVKWLAAATLFGVVVAIGAIVLSRIDFHRAGFAVRWFVAFAPLLLFWSGAWLRKPHGRLAWTTAVAAMAFSIAVGLIGAARPAPAGGFNGYTATAALKQIMHGQPPASAAAR